MAIVAGVAIRVVVAVGLIVPFVLREIDPALEPYPAVIQPAGANKVSTEEAVKFVETQLFAVKEDGSEQRVNTKDFMGRIPGHYWGNIAGARYGLEPAKTRTASVGRWSITLLTAKEASPQERKEALNWIHDRLHAQGIDDAVVLRIRPFSTLWDVETGVRVKEEIGEQTDVDITK